MLGALIKLTFEQTAVEFEWQKASFCGDCKLHSNYDCTAAENLRACMLLFRIPYRFPNFNSIPLGWIKCCCCFQYYNLFYEFRKIFWQNLDFITRDCKKFCANSLGKLADKLIINKVIFFLLLYLYLIN